MNTRGWHRAGLVAGLLLSAAVTCLGLLAVAVGHGTLRGTLIHAIAWYLGRSVEAKGLLRLHLLTRHPSLDAEMVTLGNPPWAPPGITGTAKHVALQLRWNGDVDGLTLEGADLTLQRDTEGFANWQFNQPQPGAPPLLAPLRQLQCNDVHLHLVDAQRHLEFDGSVSGGAQQGAPLALTAHGVLNTRPAQLSLSGEALATVSETKPYAFEFTATGSGSRVMLKGLLLKPFEMDRLDSSFRASGEDLKHLYFLVGLRFVDTGKFRLDGRLQRRGTLTRFSELSLVSGESDLKGSLSFESSGKRPRIEGELHSRTLRAADIGAPGATDPQLPLFSRARLSLASVRHMDGQIRWGSDHLEVGRLALSAVAAFLKLERAAVDLPSFEAQLLGGRLSAQAHLDATSDTPPVEVRLELERGDLQALPLRTENPPLTGPLAIHAHLTGHGLSVHEVAASANGSLEFGVQRGTIRASIAELAGLDLRGLGLTLAHSQQVTSLRCAVGRFHASDGMLSAQRLIIDTDTVLIDGQGTIDLRDESLELRLQGAPKRIRLLRLSSPLLVQGTLRRPRVSVQAEGASLKLIDGGRAHDADCGAP